MRPKLVLPFVLGAVFVLLASVLQNLASAASPSIYESITGTDTANINSTGSSDSVGFTGNWAMVNSRKSGATGFASIYDNAFNNYLKFPTNSYYRLPASNTAAGTAQNLWSVYYSARQISSAVNFDANGSFYLSFLGYSSSPGGNWGSYVLGLLNGLPTSSTDTSKNAIFLGRSYNGKPTVQLTTANNAAWYTGTYSAEGTANTPADASGYSWFIVTKITTVASGNDSVQIKFFASTDTVPASDSSITWDATYSGAITGSYNYLAPQTEYNALIDEIRGGATYDAVSGVAGAAIIGTPSISGTARKGVPTNLTLTLGSAGTVRFYANGRKITNCSNIPTTGSSPNFTAACSWKPLTQGLNFITADFTSSDPSYVDGKANSVNIPVLKRATAR